MHQHEQRLSGAELLTQDRQRVMRFSGPRAIGLRTRRCPDEDEKGLEVTTAWRVEPGTAKLLQAKQETRVRVRVYAGSRARTRAPWSRPRAPCFRAPRPCLCVRSACTCP